jgi:hypothetical protein
MLRHGVLDPLNLSLALQRSLSRHMPIVLKTSRKLCTMKPPFMPKSSDVVEQIQPQDSMAFISGQMAEVSF